MGKVRPENLVDRQNEILFGFSPKDFFREMFRLALGRHF